MYLRTRFLYICFGILGTLTPIGVIYAVNFDRRIPGTIFDLGLLLFSVGVSIIFIPLGIGAGLVLAVVAQLVWNRFRARSLSAGPVTPMVHSPPTEIPQGPGKPDQS